MKTTQPKKLAKLVLVSLIIAIFLAFYSFDLADILTLEYMQTHLQTIQELAQNPLGLIVFFVSYILVTSLSLPVATPMTLLAGALYGVVWGSILVSFASTLGATCAFLLVRLFFAEQVEKKFSETVARINAAFEKNSFSYILSLRLLPIFPFFLVNLCCALTRVPVSKYFIFSQLGMFPATLVFVNAGAQLSSIRAISDIASVEVLGSLALLGLLPWIVKFVSYKFYNFKKYKGNAKPKNFDYNLIVIGAGSGGLVSSYVAASIGAKVLLVEKHLMGGDCLNTGCVPSKALIHAANTVFDTNNESPLFGHLADKTPNRFSKGYGLCAGPDC